MAVEYFHLPPPPGFRGLHPDLPLTSYERRLPHWRQSGASYFVTFRLADSLPQCKTHELARMRESWLRDHPPPRSNDATEKFSREFSRVVEECIDEGYGEAVFRSRKLTELAFQAFRHFEGDRYSMPCCVVMPNHCHVIVRPFEDHPLEDVLNSWKGYLGRAVNRQLNRTGPLWQEESYDRIIRDEEHLRRVIQYIGRNPAKAGLLSESWRRWLTPAWIDAGYQFFDEDVLAVKATSELPTA